MQRKIAKNAGRASGVYKLFFAPFLPMISSITMLVASFLKGLLSFPSGELFGAPRDKPETFLQI